MTDREKTNLMGNYVMGLAGVAKYIGVHRHTVRRWRQTFPSKFPKARVLMGKEWFRKASIDRFMDPANNPTAGVKTRAGR